MQVKDYVVGKYESYFHKHYVREMTPPRAP